MTALVRRSWRATSLEPYASPEDRERRLDDAASRAKGEIVDIGTSVEGRLIRAIRIKSRNPGPTPPRVLVVANIHGVEFIGVELALAFLNDADGIHALGALAEIWVVPCLNPDAYARVFERQGLGSLAELRTNAHGVDLNRNFPRPTNKPRARIGFSGSSALGSAFYCGSGPLCEPESRALASFLASTPFHASLSLHSTGGFLIPPKVRSKLDAATYSHLCRVLRHAQPHRKYARIAFRWLDVYTGELEDHQHHALGCWSLCVEIGRWANIFRDGLMAPNVFWRMNPRDPKLWIANDVQAFFAYFCAALRAHPPVDRASCVGMCDDRGE